MSFDVLVIPEDPENNGYILRPLVSRILAECGKTNAKVTVLTNPRTKGYEHAKALLLNQLFERYRHMNLFLFLPDADGKVLLADDLCIEACQLRGAQGSETHGIGPFGEGLGDEGDGRLRRASGARTSGTPPPHRG